MILGLLMGCFTFKFRLVRSLGCSKSEEIFGLECFSLKLAGKGKYCIFVVVVFARACCMLVKMVLSGLMIGQSTFTGEEVELMVKVEFSSTDSRREPSLFLMKDFLSVSVTVEILLYFNLN